jgi:hypothetical protein
MADTRYTREYHCTACGKKTQRHDLTVKKAVFTEMGSKARTFKSRVTRQLCPRCLAKDPDWKREPYSEPEFETIPEGFEDEPEEAGDGSVQMELPLEPAHLLEPR